MKLSRLVLTVMVLAMCAAVAKADGVTDPRITIGVGGGSPVTFAGSSQINPLIVEDASGSNPFQYMGPDTNVFFIEVIPFSSDEVPMFLSEAFTCDPGIAASCGFVSPCQPVQPGANCPNPNAPFAVEAVFIGPADSDVPLITTGMHILVTVPEPGVMVLLLVGLASLIGFGLRQREPSLS